MARIMGTQRRRLVATSIAIMLALATMTPATTDARSGGSFGGHGGGHGGLHGGHGHFGAPHSLQGTGRRSMSGFAIARAFPSSSHRHLSFPRRFAFLHSHAIGSHFFTLGYDGIWLDNYLYAPTVLITQPPAIVLQQPIATLAPSVKTPSAAQPGIVVVRGNTMSYVTFPSASHG